MFLWLSLWARGQAYGEWGKYHLLFTCSFAFVSIRVRANPCMSDKNDSMA